MDPIKILIVDDEEEFRRTLCNRLTRRKFDVIDARSGDEALKCLDEREVDVVVLDVKMPGIDGLSTTREIKSRFPQVEVVLLTGHANAEASIRGLEMGAFDYLLKPADIDELVYIIQDAAKRKRLGR